MYIYIYIRMYIYICIYVCVHIYIYISIKYNPSLGSSSPVACWSNCDVESLRNAVIKCSWQHGGEAALLGSPAENLPNKPNTWNWLSPANPPGEWHTALWAVSCSVRSVTHRLSCGINHASCSRQIQPCKPFKILIIGLWARVSCDKVEALWFHCVPLFTALNSEIFHCQCSFVTTTRGSASRTLSLAGGILGACSSMLRCIATRVICSIIIVIIPPARKIKEDHH